jgi:UDP-glucose 4-epimerase
MDGRGFAVKGAGLMSRTRWQNRSVVVLGGNGFIGSNLVSSLAQDGARVLSVDLSLPTRVLPGVDYVEGSILDGDLVGDLVAEAQTVFSLAGAGCAPDGLTSSLASLEVNCRGQLLLLEAAAKRNPQARLIFPGSRLEYGVPRYLPVDESHPINPESLYALHRFVGGRYFSLYARDMGLHTIVCRISNPYGPHPCEWSRRYSILNAVVDQVVHGETVQVFGDGVQLRDYIYIDDLISALKCSAASNSAGGGTYNIGSGIPLRFVDVVRLAVQLVGRGDIAFVPWPPEWRIIETGDFYFCIDSAKRDLDWTPRWQIQEGLRASAQAAQAALDASD